MSGEQRIDIDIRPWSDGDLPLLERLMGEAAVLERARAEGKHQFIHAFPSVDNGPSNAICRKMGFTLQGQADFEYPPGNFMRCNDWRFDLFADVSEAPPA